ncbi:MULTISPECIES: FAD-binding oxidoreductase [Micromonospora]|uniref:FAD-binding oxidoreductase n=1 Tax=Micromonospora solifontis TaxID=2487138 RepID=A0ABX9WL56_9ACTN|nr:MULTISPECIES: FAD-binding oxidoreductase [Micromonospora]NES14906.1 FAD-binding oxidoreductase [Micromonospora sp. PPF5-17B]NES35171.1 FAD-binding oxidoreductase [Micromonospora solifontis]NES55166.1 FAD-binding oxidoreductase [Micromonospora sp. PPF5-6]RNM01152.1 FAD-binding oxidoreductase [Micromonospora solifontis]
MAGKHRSWWGWGHVEDAVTGAEATALADRVRTLLPDVDLAEHVAPPVAELGLRPPRVDPPASLAGLCSTDPADRAAHTHGKAFRDVVRNLHGDLRDPPDLVVRPATEQDVVDVLDWCAGRDIAVIPYGGGSSVVGGVEPRLDEAYPAAVSLDLGRLDRVLEVDPTSRAARIQAGVFGPALEDQLRPHGLTLRHFPQSFEFSTLGGWLATRAGGHYATVLTHIDDLVESLRVVTPAGTSQSRRLPGSGAGPSPDRLFLGSEGVLGVITEAWMRLQDRPRWRAGASVHFTDYDEAVAATRAIAQSGLQPSNCRLLDPAEALLNAGAATTGGVLVLGFESADHPVTPWLDRAVELCRDHGGSLPAPPRGDGASGPPRRTAADAWRSAFLRMPYQRDALAARSMIVETFETACTWDRFPALRAAVLDAAGEALRSVAATGVITCRFTHVYPDGPAPYFGVYATGRWGSTLAQWDQIKHAVSDALLAAGGTITHHHAIGRDHRPWYDRQRPDPVALALRGAKSALDPSWILNPGVLVDPPAGGPTG